MKQIIYQGKKYKQIDILPNGTLVLCKWVKGKIPTIFGFDIPYFYRGVIFATPTKDSK